MKEPYLTMAMNSLRMLRSHSSIPVICIVIGELNSVFEEFASHHKIHIFPRSQHQADPDNFLTNKLYLREFSKNHILFIDSDTFIFDDVNKIFDRYQDLDFVACENSWAYGKGYKSNIKPFNGGILLMKDSLKVFQGFEENYNLLKAGETEIGEWLHQTKNFWVVEEFSLSKGLSESGLRCEYFERQFCYNVKWPQDFQSMQDSIIFHSYTGQWKTAFQNLQPKKKFRPKFIPK